MIKIDEYDGVTEMIEFGDGKKVWLKLPVIGHEGTPSGITNAWMAFWEKYTMSGSITGVEVAQTWTVLWRTIEDVWPEYGRKLNRLPQAVLQQVFTEWARESKERTGVDPKDI